MAMSASKEGGKHERDDFTQQLLLGPQATFDLGHQGIGKIQVFEGLMDGFNIVLGLSALVLETFLGFELAAFSGFGLFVGISFGWGHGKLLPFRFQTGFEGNRAPIRVKSLEIL
jgi:hypothetical protein